MIDTGSNFALMAHIKMDRGCKEKEKMKMNGKGSPRLANVLAVFLACCLSAMLTSADVSSKQIEAFLETQD